MNAPEPTPTDGKLPVVFDLDGTLAEATWPSNHIGNRIQAGIELLLEYSSRGYAIVIHTARPASHEGRIWGWLLEQGLQNVVFNVVCGKPLGCLYIDDRAFRPDFVEDLGPEPEFGEGAPVISLVTKDEPEEEEDVDDEVWEPNDEENAAPAPSANDPERWTVMD